MEYGVNVCIPQHLQVLYGGADALQGGGGGVFVAVKQQIKRWGAGGGRAKEKKRLEEKSVSEGERQGGGKCRTSCTFRMSWLCEGSRQYMGA